MVMLHSTVTRILVDPLISATSSGMSRVLPKAVGVEYHDDGESEAKTNTAYLKASAMSAVIVSAGSLLTPAIVMRSGIGPRKVLDAALVSSMVDSPGVGQGLQDHRLVGMVFRVGSGLSACKIINCLCTCHVLCHEIP